jgi:hypothetical protein
MKDLKDFLYVMSKVVLYVALVVGALLSIYWSIETVRLFRGN